MTDKQPYGAEEQHEMAELIKHKAKIVSKALTKQGRANYDLIDWKKNKENKGSGLDD